MTYTILFKTEATNEYIEAYDWYEQKLKGLGKRFQIAVENKLNLICQNPEVYRQVKKSFRQAVIDDFSICGSLYNKIKYEFNLRLRYLSYK